MSAIQPELPPSNSKRVYRWLDLPNTLTTELYRIIDGGKEVSTFTASEHKRQVLEGLIQHPIYSASYCRISDQVLALRSEGVDIECKMYRNDPETGRKRYGVYFLNSKIERIEAGEVAA